jgi:hypothetical protein
MADTSSNDTPFNWGSALNQILDTGAAVVKASVDKPISNAVQTQPTNQSTSAPATAQVVAVSQQKPMNWMPYAIGGGVLLIGVFFLVAMKSAKS